MNKDIIGKRVARVDAVDKVSGTAKFVEDLCPTNALIAKILHSTIANGVVTNVDVDEALVIPGVEKIVTCFDVPDICYPTAGHPWSLEVSHQDVADRKLLNQRVRYLGDDIAVVVAVDEVIADRALKAIKVTYDEYPPLVSWEDAIKEGAGDLHEECPGNILKQSGYKIGDLADAVTEQGLIFLEKEYSTAPVQHCHIEPMTSFAYIQNDKIVVTCSTQIPHIVRRVIGQALGIPWGKVRVIKPYVGGGFGNKQDVHYEPLNAYLTTVMGGRCVFLQVSREEVFTSTRRRHGADFHIKAWVRPDGRLVARDITAYTSQGGYASHGHAIIANIIGNMRYIYQDEKATAGKAVTVYTNMSAAGAMRGYGVPQAAFGAECLMDDLALTLHMDPIAIREKNMMKLGYVDPELGITCHSTGLTECIRRGREYSDWDKKRNLYADQTGSVRRGVGMAIFTYRTAIHPIALETSSVRMILNQDGSVQMQLGATEIGQGGDTVFSQMAAAATGLEFEDIHILSTQDTDISPFDTGAYASRQTYVAGMAIKQTGEMMRGRILEYAAKILDKPAELLDISGKHIVDKYHGEKLMTVALLAQNAFYSRTGAKHISAESTHNCTDNTFAFGCCFAEVEVDIPMGKVKIIDIINVHDSGVVINPALAEGQIHGGQSMGIGAALSEQMLYDEKGRLLNGNLLDYKLPTSMDVSDLHAEFVQTVDPTGPFGNKALGEPPVVPVAPAIRNAVLNATGIAIDDLPLEPKKLVRIFTEKGLI